MSDTLPPSGRIYETMLAIAGHFEDIAYEIRMLAQEVRPDLPLRASPDLLARPIEDLEISVRSQNCLTTYGVKTIGDLVSLTKVEFRRIPHFGVKSRREVAEVVQNLGLRFGTLRP
jgi:DNA-directed RNA polymerase subunit alpha